MKKNKPLWIAITAVALVLIVTAATTVVPGLKISQYPLTTAPNGNDLFILADVTVVPNTNRSYKYTTLTNAIITLATNSVRIFAGTNVTVDRTNSGYIISVTNITGGTGGTATASAPLNSIQFNSNSVFAGDSRLMYTNGNVGLGTNDPKFLLSLHNTNISEPAIDIGYDAGAGNTIAVQIRSGTGVTNMTMAVDGTLNSVTIFNSGSITGSSATVSALGVTGGALGVGKVLTDMGGSGSATWQNPSAPLGYITNAWTTNLAGTPVIGASSLSISNATTNFNFYGLDSNTVARLWEIGQATNGANAYASNLVSTATNNFLAITTNIANVASTNNVSVAAGTNTTVETNVVGNHIEYRVNASDSFGAMTPGVVNVASASAIVIDLALTNTPVVVLTNAPAHVMTLVLSNPAPGRWFSFYADGNGGITNNAIGWGGVDGLLLKWLDASTNSIIVSNGFVSVAGYVAQTASRTNLVITHRHE